MRNDSNASREVNTAVENKSFKNKKKIENVATRKEPFQVNAKTKVGSFNKIAVPSVNEKDKKHCHYLRTGSVKTMRK